MQTTYGTERKIVPLRLHTHDESIEIETLTFNCRCMRLQSTFNAWSTVLAMYRLSFSEYCIRQGNIRASSRKHNFTEMMLLFGAAERFNVNATLTD